MRNYPKDKYTHIDWSVTFKNNNFLRPGNKGNVPRQKISRSMIRDPYTKSTSFMEEHLMTWENPEVQLYVYQE